VISVKKLNAWRNKKADRIKIYQKEVMAVSKSVVLFLAKSIIDLVNKEEEKMQR
jgi:hypothetical protein